jgi:hypothetical protein
MRRRRRIRAAAAILVLAAAAIAAGLALLAAGGPSGLAAISVGRIADNVAPGAAVALVPAQAAVAGAQALEVMLPAALITPPPGAGTPQNDSTTAALYAAAGWRGALIASIAALKVPRLTQFTTTNAAGEQAAGAPFYLDGSVRTAPGQNLARLPKLDKVAPAQELEQLDDNLAALTRGLPRGSIVKTAVAQIVVDPTERGMAYAVNLRVRDLRTLRGHLGDILIGLATGLAPGPDSTVEGLAIDAEDAAGRSAGTWIATRTQQATTVIDPRIHAPAVLVPRIRFADLTRGPRPVASAPAGPIG